MPNRPQKRPYATRAGKETVGVGAITKYSGKKSKISGVFPSYSLKIEGGIYSPHSISGKSKRAHEWAELKGVLEKMGYTVKRLGKKITNKGTGKQLDQTYFVILHNGKEIKGETLKQLFLEKLKKPLDSGGKQ